MWPRICLDVFDFHTTPVPVTLVCQAGTSISLARRCQAPMWTSLRSNWRVVDVHATEDQIDGFHPPHGSIYWIATSCCPNDSSAGTPEATTSAQARSHGMTPSNHDDRSTICSSAECIAMMSSRAIVNGLVLIAPPFLSPGCFSFIHSQQPSIDFSEKHYPSTV